MNALNANELYIKMVLIINFVSKLSNLSSGTAENLSVLFNLQPRSTGHRDGEQLEKIIITTSTISSTCQTLMGYIMKEAVRYKQSSWTFA